MRAVLSMGLVLGLVMLLPATSGAAKPAVARVVAAPVAATAAPTTAEADQQYLALVADAHSGKEIDWQRLRDLYTHTSFYDPYGGAEKIWYMLQQAGQKIVYEGTPEAMQEYNKLLDEHFAHFRSHMQALEMIEKGHLPDSERALHTKALAFITGAILATGNGKTPETAFRVIDPAEESMLLKTYFHYNLDSQEFRQQAGHFWDVVHYTDPSTGDKGSLYFNVDQILFAPAKSARR